MIDHSPATMLVERLVRSRGVEGAHEALHAALAKFTPVELAALDQWWEFWARSKQLAPQTPWRSWGFLAGRGLGKTMSVSKFVNEEVREGRAGLICLLAQDEQSAIDLQVLGPNGLIANSPPWFPAEWEASALQVVWPKSGARAYVRTPEVPGKIRGLEYHLTWATELQSWPVATRDEAWSNVEISTRLGYARTVWDCTPKKGHPILLELLKRSAAEPDRHVIIRGTTYENLMNLGSGYVQDLERKYAGTAKGREELLGEMLDNADKALVKLEWIVRARRPMPARLVRRVISVDPAVTTRKGSDRTGINEAGLGVDSQVYVIADLSGKHAAHEWADIVLDRYVRGACDVVVVETNKGGNLLTQNLRAAAAKLGLVVRVVDDRWQPHHLAGTVFVREIYSRGPKEDRAVPLATAYERGRVSHVEGADLRELEEWLTSWEPVPGARSPDNIDAEVHAVGELLGFGRNEPEAREGFAGLTDMSRALTGAAAPATVSSPPRQGGGNLATLLGGGRSGGGI